MKKLLLLLIASLFLLSSCYSYNEVNMIKDNLQQEINNERDIEYYNLQEEYYEASSRVDVLENAISKLFDEYLTLMSYYLYEDEDVSEKDLYNSVRNMNKIFTDLDM